MAVAMTVPVTTDRRTAAAGIACVRQGLARGLALFLGAFTLLNVLGDLRVPGFDANLWWIDTRPLPAIVTHPVLAGMALALLAYGVHPRLARWRRGCTLGALVGFLAITAANTLTFYRLLGHGTLHTAMPVPVSLVLMAALVAIIAGIWHSPVASDGPTRALLACTLCLCAIGFPLVQMYAFGKTDYRRPADVIVVFGARAHADGRCSQALADRVLTACALYRQGLAPRLLFSGGPGDGTVHETEAMRRLAVSQGVPDAAILVDRDGLDTRATAHNTCVMFRRLGVHRVLAVSHFFHLPRVKMAYQRAGQEVYTVPADEGRYPLAQTPFLMAREVVALWAYYLQPLY